MSAATCAATAPRKRSQAKWPSSPAAARAIYPCFWAMWARACWTAAAWAACSNRPLRRRFSRLPRRSAPGRAFCTCTATTPATLWPSIWRPRCARWRASRPAPSWARTTWPPARRRSAAGSRASSFCIKPPAAQLQGWGLSTKCWPPRKRRKTPPARLDSP
jgi:hypothetical protein